MKNPDRIEKMMRTSDDWHPNFPGEYVRVNFIKLRPGCAGQFLGGYRVCVWGDDDEGMEKDFLVEHMPWKKAKREAYTLYHSLKEPITKQGLKALGFVPA